MPQSRGLAKEAGVRTRRGCLTCRKRRRKCDEKKPKCQNCTTRDLHCRYGVNLTFLEANKLTLLPEDASALEFTTPRTYRHIKFVDGLNEGEDIAGNYDEEQEHVTFLGFTESCLPETQQALHQPDDTDGSPLRDESYVIVDTEPSQSQYCNDLNDSTNINQNFENDVEDNTNIEAASQDHEATISYSHTPESLQLSRPGQNTLIEDYSLIGRARNNLVITQEVSFPTSPLDLRENQNLPSEISHIEDWLPQENTPNQVSYTNRSYEALSPQDFSSNNKQNQLLKFYVDEVAPWLDITSLDSSFRVYIPVLTKTSGYLLDALIALASRWRSMLRSPSHADVSESNELLCLANRSVAPNMYSNREEAVAASSILTICELMPLEIPDWKEALKIRIGIFDSLDITGHCDGNRGATSWTILRLDLAHAISSESPITTSIEKWHQNQALFWDPRRSSYQSSSSSECVRRVLLLCAHAAQLCFSSDLSNPRGSQPAIDVWTQLWTSTLSWLQILPSAMHSILTSPISSLSSSPPFFYPLILYTSRQSLYATVLYHTICLLLLQCHPPSCRKSSQLKTPPWHAVQICGICIGNDAHWSWDPTILAVLLHAARYISYHEQQRELWKFLRLAARESGWKIDRQIEGTVERWKINNGFSIMEPD